MRADISIHTVTIITLVALANGQGVHPRQPVHLAGSSVSNSKAPSLGGPGIASSGDTSAVVWVDASDDGLYVSVSNGRGLSWSAPLRVDEAVTPSTKYLRRRAVVVADDFVTMMWGDLRGGSWDVYSNVLHVPTMGLAGEQRVSTTYAPGESHAGQHIADIANGGDGCGSCVYVVFVEVNDAGHSLYLASSSDYGARFDDPVPIAVEEFPAGDLTVWSPVLAAEGMSVFVAWLDNRHDPQAPFPRDVFLQWSDEGGLPATFQEEPKQLDTDGSGVGDPEAVSIDVAGDMVAAVWHNKTGFALFDDEVHCRVSRDGGASFGDDLVVNPDITLANLYFPRVAINPSSCAVHVGWIDDDPTLYLGPGLWAKTSTDCGSSFSFQTTPLSASLGANPDSWSQWGFVVEESTDVEATISAYWWDSPVFDWPPSLRGRIAEGANDTWTTRFTLAEDVANEGFQWSSAAYNALYRNFLYAWRGREGIVEIGGYRPQTLNPAGWEPGEATVSFALDRFDASDDATAWAIMSLDQGDPIDLGGKILGLLPDPLLMASVGLAADGIWAAELDGEGAGSTSELEAVLPAGVSLYAVGIGLDLQAMTVDVGSITDVIEIEL